MSETDKEKLERVAMMASGDSTWDLSDNDTDALKFALAQLADRDSRLAALVEALDKIMVGGNHLASQLMSYSVFPENVSSYKEASRDHGQLYAVARRNAPNRSRIRRIRVTERGLGSYAQK